MTVATTTNKAIFTGNGATTVFPFTFGTLPTGDLVVTLYDLNNLAIPQTEITHYTVQGKGEEDGGSVTFITPPPTGYKVLIQRLVPFTQPTDLKNQGSFYPRTHERAFDRSVMQAQQLDEVDQRAMRLPPQVSGVSTELPVPQVNTIFGWNPTGTAIQNYPLSTIATSITYGNKTYQKFTGTGAQTNFTLSQDPASLGNLAVSIDGVTQVPVDDYTYLATTLTFSTAPANGAVILVRYDVALPIGSAAGAAVTYNAGGAGAYNRDVQAHARERPSVLDYIDPAEHAAIAAGTSTFNCTPAFNAALTAHSEVQVPPGRYRLLDAVTAFSSGKILRAAGPRKTVLEIPATFNLSATGVFVFPAAEPGPEIEGITFEFMGQPDSASAAAYIHYPPAVYAQNCPRFKIRNCRIAKAWNGIDMKGNSGGAVIDDLELSMFNIGLDIDGSLDSIKVNKLHLWPFSVSGETFTTNNRTVFAAAYGIKSGRCDDFHLTDSLIFSVTNGAYFYNSASGRTFGNINNTDFDDRGGLVIDTLGDLNVTGCVFTLGKTDSRLLYMTGGTLQVSCSRFRGDVINGSANGAIEITGGAAVFTGNQMYYLGNDAVFLYWTNATVELIGNSLVRNTNIAYTIAFLRASANGLGLVSGNNCSTLGSGSGKLITIDADNGLVVRGNRANGWTVATPAANALANTMVQGNLGAGSNKDEFVGYFDSTAAATVKLPSGWTVSRLGTGNYAVTHNLSLAAATDLLPICTADLTANGGFVQWDIAASTTNALRLRTFVGTTLTDLGVAFRFQRYRSAQ